MAAAAFLLLGTTGLALFIQVLFPVALAYVALRVRDQRLRASDPQLGLKTAFHVLLTMSVVMLLGGLSLSLADICHGILTGNQRNVGPGPFGGGNNAFVGARPPAGNNDEFWNWMQRTAAALAGCGLLFALLFRLLLTSTNDHRFPSVRRVFLGGRLALSLMIILVSVTMIAVISVQEKPDLEPVEALIGVVIVWAPSAVVHLLLFRRAARLPIEPAKIIVVESSPDE